MPFTNARVEIQVGNVESQLLGPAPVARLHRELNPRGAPVSRAGDPDSLTAPVLVFDPSRQTFLTGSLARVKRILRSEGIRFRLCDLRSDRRGPCEWQLRKEVRLRDFQTWIVTRALERQRGLIDVGTGGGKTLLAAAILARLGLPVLWLVTTRTLLAQTRRELQRYLGVAPGVIGDGVRDARALTVALAQRVARQSEDVSRWADGVLIFDEGHHAVASIYFDLIRRVGARYNYYLSATPFRENNEQAILDALTGGPFTDAAYRARFLIERGYCAPVDVHVLRCEIRGEMAEKPFPRLYDEFIVGNSARNGQIVETAQTHLDRRDSVLILVDRKQHGRLLLERLADHAALIHGDCSKSILRERVAAFEAGELPCLIATAGLFVEGVSIGRIHALIQAGGLKSRARVIQSVGRGMRLAPGKSKCVYIDFFDDDSVGIFRAHSMQRFRVLMGEGFHVPRHWPTRRGIAGDEPIPARWSHVPETREFVAVDGDGTITARGRCISKDLVPGKFCKVCKHPTLCRDGGETTWRQDEVTCG